MERVALGIIAGLHLGGLVFTENFGDLPAVAAAYAAAWWIVRMGGAEMTTTMNDETALMRERREAERARALAELLWRRPDLAGVHPAADLATEAVRWCA